MGKMGPYGRQFLGLGAALFLALFGYIMALLDSNLADGNFSAIAAPIYTALIAGAGLFGAVISLSLIGEVLWPSVEKIFRLFR